MSPEDLQNLNRSAWNPSFCREKRTRSRECCIRGFRTREYLAED